MQFFKKQVKKKTQWTHHKRKKFAQDFMMQLFVITSIILSYQDLINIARVKKHVEKTILILMYD